MSESEKKLTESARCALEMAKQHAEFLGQTYIGSEHIVLGIMLEGKSAAAISLRRQGISSEEYVRIIERHIGRGLRSKLTYSDLSLEMQNILSNLFKGIGLVGTKQMLIPILSNSHSAGRLYLQEAGCDIEQLISSLNNLQAEEITTKIPKKVREREGILRKYSTDLTELAQEQKLDPVIGREKETEQVIRTLSRRSKNNPCLVGEAGVGKTAIVEGLAQKIAAGEVPEQLLGKHILALDMTALLAGSKFRGEFEERIQNCLNEALSRGDCILFIDEMHVLSEAGSAEGATSAANLLKPQLARGELQVIGATTFSEYKKFIEKDSALSRRFQKITVEEPDTETAIKMLKGLAGRYELHHSVKIPSETIEAAVKLSQRYLPERKLPDKALDLIDETAAYVSRNRNNRPSQQELVFQAQIYALDEEKREFMRQGDFKRAAAVSDREVVIRQKLNNLQMKNAFKEISVSSEDIAEILSEQSGIKLQTITMEESEKLLKFEENLSRSVIGQEQALKVISQSIRCSRAGLSDPKRPQGSFLFLGPTGVGKTELCKVLAKELFGSQDMLIRLDMSEFSQEYMVSRLIGAPAGYVGYQEGGKLTEAVRQKPYSLILFDELEKAHPKVFDLLLQVLEEGELNDAEGKKISFKNCVIIMTSNVGANHFFENKSIGFESSSDASYEKAAAKSREELKKQFRPEFINRIDEIVVFKKLNEKAMEKICKKLLSELSERISEKKISINFSEKTVENLCKNVAEQELGARPLRRNIHKFIENPLAERLLMEKYKNCSEISVDFDGKEYIFDFDKKTALNGKSEEIAFTG